MTDREKRLELTDLINKGWGMCTRTRCEECVFSEIKNCRMQYVAAYLLNHGVTVCERETLHQMYEQGKYEGAYEGQKWIPVTERLPNDKKIIDGEEYIKNVAIRIKDNAAEKIAFYDEEEKCWFDTDFFPVDGEVTHWMPLPEPPKEG